jgi:hypothetical protein
VDSPWGRASFFGNISATISSVGQWVIPIFKPLADKVSQFLKCFDTSRVSSSWYFGVDGQWIDIDYLRILRINGVSRMDSQIILVFPRDSRGVGDDHCWRSSGVVEIQLVWCGAFVMWKGKTSTSVNSLIL